MSDMRGGLGRGQALRKALKKMDLSAHSDDTTPEATEPSVAPSVASSVGPSVAPSVAPSVVSTISGATATTMGGRGRGVAMLLSKMRQQAAGSHIGPASDVSPSQPPLPITKGVGRGTKLLASLRAQKPQAPPAAGAGAAPAPAPLPSTEVSQSVQASSVAIPKNKYFREVKSSAPVVMLGESGTPCDVTANYIYLNFEENNVFEYEVRFDPDQDYKHLRFKLLNEHNHLFKEKTFDGTTLYVPHMLPEEALNLVSTKTFDDSKVNITITFRRTRRLSEMIHIYNVLFKNIMRDLQLVRFGQQFFNERSAIQIPQHKLEVWPGYVTAVDEYEGGLMLTLDSTHRVLRTENVHKFIQDAALAQGDWKRAVSESLVGCSVMTTYNKKLFRVDSIDYTMTPKSTFEKNEGGQLVKISYIDYYKKNYGIEIMDWEQPMLISRDSKRQPGTEAKVEFMICLVPELCQLTGLSDSQRTNFRLMKDVATYTRITPNQRHAAFKKYISNVMNNETARNRLAGWGLSIAPKTVDIVARTLPPETLYFGNGAKVAGKPNADWNFEVTKNSVMQAVDVLRWVVLYTNKDKQVTNDFIETIKRCSRPMGVNVSQPQQMLLANDRTDTFVQALRKAITPDLQLVVAICPSPRDDRYAAIKRICCADNPIPSQVINARTISNSQKIRSITQKILLQINCKLGGTLWHISIPFKTAMIIGIDCYHDGTRKKRSVCSFVASYNQTMTHWYSKAVFQERGQEIVDSLKSCLVSALKHYLRTNGRLPDRIIMFRDGVGDGQLKLIQSYEIPQMQICFTMMGGDYRPTLTYVVVQKRINTRIFLKAGDGMENPPPGTVVDNKITRRDWYDFLIVAQKVGQGTVTPTHYVVAHDDSGMTPDQCQRLTYKMCHLYYNWPGTVRVPAPCQYAHKLAYLVGENINQQPSDVLADKLYFL